MDERGVRLTLRGVVRRHTTPQACGAPLQSALASPAAEESLPFDAEEWLCSWCSTLNLGSQICINKRCLRDRATAGVGQHGASRARKAPDRFTGSPLGVSPRQSVPFCRPSQEKKRPRPPEPSGCVSHVQLRVDCEAVASEWPAPRAAGRVARPPLVALPALYRVVVLPDTSRLAGSPLHAVPLSPNTANEVSQTCLQAHILQVDRVASPLLPSPTARRRGQSAGLDQSRVAHPKLAFKQAALRERILARGSPLRPPPLAPAAAAPPVLAL